MSNFGGLTKYLNSATLNANKLSITNIDIEQIAENANNFYGLRDIEELASMIATSEYIEPLEVVPAENGSYRLIAGHRRRAAISLLISQGLRESKEVPCIIRNFSPANGLTADEIETINLIFSNRGQRRKITPSEQLREIQLLEPLAKKIFNSDEFIAENNGKRGSFRKFFAETILNISESHMQRLSSLQKLSTNALRAFEDNVITQSTAIRLSSMPHEEQDRFIEDYNDDSQDYPKDFSESLGEDKSFVCDDFNDFDAEEFTAKSDETDEEIYDEDDTSSMPDRSEDKGKDSVQAAEADDSSKADTVRLKDSIQSAEDLEQEAENWLLASLTAMLDNTEDKLAKAMVNSDEVEKAKWTIRKAKLQLIISLIKE